MKWSKGHYLAFSPSNGAKTLKNNEPQKEATSLFN
jgi:hypothetical protein